MEREQKCRATWARSNVEEVFLKKVPTHAKVAGGGRCHVRHEDFKPVLGKCQSVVLVVWASPELVVYPVESFQNHCEFACSCWESSRRQSLLETVSTVGDDHHCRIRDRHE